MTGLQVSPGWGRLYERRQKWNPPRLTARFFPVTAILGRETNAAVWPMPASCNALLFFRSRNPGALDNTLLVIVGGLDRYYFHSPVRCCEPGAPLPQDRETARRETRHIEEGDGQRGYRRAH